MGNVCVYNGFTSTRFNISAHNLTNKKEHLKEEEEEKNILRLWMDAKHIFLFHMAICPTGLFATHTI